MKGCYRCERDSWPLAAHHSDYLKLAHGRRGRGLSTHYQYFDQQRDTHTHTLTRWDVTISRHYMPAQLFMGSIIYRQQLVRLFLLLQHIIIVPFLQTLTKFLSDIFWYSSTIRHVLNICICIRIWQYFISTIRQIAAVALLPEIQTVFRFSISVAAVPPHVQIDTIFS